MHTEEHNEQIIPEFMCMCVRRSKDLLKEKNHCVWIVVHVSLYAWWVIKWFKHKKGNDTVIAVYICETGSVCDLKFDFFVYTKQLNQVKIPHKKHKHTNGNGTFSVRSIWFCVFCGCTTANCSTDEFRQMNVRGGCRYYFGVHVFVLCCWCCCGRYSPMIGVQCLSHPNNNI